MSDRVTVVDIILLVFLSWSVPRTRSERTDELSVGLMFGMCY